MEVKEFHCTPGKYVSCYYLSQAEHWFVFCVSSIGKKDRWPEPGVSWRVSMFQHTQSPTCCSYLIYCYVCISFTPTQSATDGCNLTMRKQTEKEWLISTQYLYHPNLEKQTHRFEMHWWHPDFRSSLGWSCFRTVNGATLIHKRAPRQKKKKNRGGFISYLIRD